MDTEQPELVGRPLICDAEAYSKSLISFISSLEPINVTLKCIKEHVVPLISFFLENHSPPFCILSVGSGEGYNDLPFLEMLSKADQGKAGKPVFFVRAIEPDKMKLDAFCAKAEDLPESLKMKANIKFEWFPMTYQEYVEQKRKDEVKFDVIHFLHSIYYVNVESALKHCYEEELGAKGVIFSFTQDVNSPYVRYGSIFSSQDLVCSPGSYYSNKEVTDVAKKNGWKYVECSGESITGDITAIFDRTSEEGNLLLDFLTQCVNVSLSTSQENLQKILNFWENECTDDGNGKKIISFQTRTVIIFKGI